ncbi:MAG: hypothetical protein L6R41_001932 [Letrouitia leprolyta]|nr:MAG: hypothetical protein L6R41_001932 [Letrouitia leprolyta]
MPHAVTPRILFIDAYDSFSNNIISLLESKIPGVDIFAIKIDDVIPNFGLFLRHFDAVVAGPGPGHPENENDVGLIAELWKLSDADVLPVLGICLGFQSLVATFGGTIRRLPAPRHGIVRRVTHYDSSIFKGVGCIAPVQYHSLHAEVNPDAEASQTSSRLEPLAWDLKEDNDASVQIMEHESNPCQILMAVKHRDKPFYGTQFHPESICSDEGCQKIVENWWLEAQQWNKQCRIRHVPGANAILSEDSKPGRIEQDVDTLRSRNLLPSIAPTSSDSIYGILNTISTRGWSGGLRRVISRCIPLNGLSVPQICELLQVGDQDAVVLDAEPHQRPDVGVYSIIGAIQADTSRLEYSTGAGKLIIRHGKHHESVDLTRFGNNVFDFLKYHMHDCKTTGGSSNVPFWGGLIGYISYEACLETIDIATSSNANQPDISFAFVERSVVVDHQRQQIHVQTIKGDDDDKWVQQISSRLATLPTQPSELTVPGLNSVITHPEPGHYKGKIRKCKEKIHDGESYELCLTNLVTIDTRHLTNPWPLYLRLRSLNAAPFSAYMRLGGMTLLSSSPERFMRWSRPTSSETHLEETKSTVQFRPIKGTVKRHPHGPNKPAITLEQATALLATPKERAENLMIVDLIRHDLHGVVGSGNICVPKLMVVEEYATLFQLVTVIEGTLINRYPYLSNPPSLTTSSQSSPCSSRPTTPSLAARSESPIHHLYPHPPSTKPTIPKTGIDVLAASLPPGSMTGAPKRRSCALLCAIEEEQPRSIYSGVVGYMDVGGGGDFSVVIRSAFRWDNDTTFEQHQDGKGKKRDTWNVGAGGAITSLSTEEGEWEEMIAKLGSTLRIFE